MIGGTHSLSLALSLALFPSSSVVDLAPACKTLESEGVLLRMLEENAGQTVTLRAQRQRHGGVEEGGKSRKTKVE